MFFFKTLSGLNVVDAISIIGALMASVNSVKSHLVARSKLPQFINVVAKIK